MDRHILFVQGGGDDAYAYDQGLVTALSNQFDSSWHVHYPAMPNESYPDYQEWKEEIGKRLHAFSRPAILVGHSIGASVILKYLCDHPTVLPQAVLAIATPYWHDDKFWFWPQVALPPDVSARMPPQLPIYLYQATDDNTVPTAHFHELSKRLPRATARLFQRGGHQCEEHADVMAKDIQETFTARLK